MHPKEPSNLGMNSNLDPEPRGASGNLCLICKMKQAAAFCAWHHGTWLNQAAGHPLFICSEVALFLAGVFSSNLMFWHLPEVPGVPQHLPMSLKGLSQPAREAPPQPEGSGPD